MLRLWDAISRRWLYLAGALIVAGLFGAALYLQYVLRQDPCPLCMLQRVIFIVIGVLFGLAALHNARQIGARIYAVLIGLFAIAGVAVALRHIWIQHLPKDQVPACGPGLDYMLKNFPMSDVLQELMHGSGECAAKGWTFLTLGIPEWSLLWFVLLGMFALAVGWKKN
ncbi:disulfide bond formation protein B [Sideroxyarcus emersonii]|uniref:Disulfide bond formation protein B n=1 Tax=Sideroxyarcus emersonii TaxID=2764705 RepID=A0AAN1XB70_9PROT|nr:disulfide bond formation protein B [Sideroxyarcus emersonii]BCK88200.1 disulfide bond formation protein B [Sideroxyarcus emersonii]